MSKDAKIKFDFNLLLSGTWVLDNRNEKEIHYFEKTVGKGKIVIYNALDIPSPRDSKLLDYLMKISQENDWNKEIVLPSISKALKDLGLGRSKRDINKFEYSLKILKNTHIEFHNCFIDNGILEYFEEGDWQLISIGIIAKYGFKPIKGRGNPLQVKVIFDNDFIAICRHSIGYKLIPYAPIQGLRDTAYALYKWAWRWFDSSKGYGERWIGNSKSLIQWYKNELNSTANYKYPSKVLERVSNAIKQLNNNPEVPFYLQIKKENNSFKIEIYRKEKVTTKREIPYDKLPHILKQTIISLARRKKHIQNEYALARSMSWKEIEDSLKKVAVVSIPEDAWEVFEIVFQTNQKEKEEFDKTVLAVSHSKATGEVFISAEKSKFKGRNILTKLIDVAYPKWKDNLHDAVKWAESEKILAAAE